ncbi:hypothetical protein [Glaciecola sp. 1036]|uniref:hypothetical protein n=1 Tax=Alteromonadaceae TaxID=72275 RepID=UPI003D07EFE3
MKLDSKHWFIGILCLQMSFLTYPQENAQTVQSTEKEEVESLSVEPQPQGNPTASSGPVLRLEDTIRGNKEQPQVLTIVPWQLPTHKRIDATTQWQPVVDKLTPIERGRFLRNMQIIKEISTEKVEEVQTEQ